MKKVQYIEIWFENCIALELPIGEFEYLKIDNVSIEYEKCNSSCSLTERYLAYGGIKFILRSDVHQGRFLSLTSLTTYDEDPYFPCNHDTILEALSDVPESECSNTISVSDIVSIVLSYDDGSKKRIYVPFKLTTADCVENALRTTRFDKQGRLVVEIHPDDSDAIENDDDDENDEKMIP